jgi:hypothetical protein
MPTNTFEYAVIRVVPRVDRQEFINVGVIVSCPNHDFLQARIELDHERLRVLAPQADISVIEEHLRAIALICEGGEKAGPIGQLPQRARFHWLVAPRSTMIQFSPAHSGLCENPAAALDRLYDEMVRPPSLQGT